MEKTSVCLMNDSFPPLIDGVAVAVQNYARVIEQDYGSACVVTPYMPGADDSVYPYPVVRYPSLDVTKWVGYRAGMPFSAKVLENLEDRSFDLIHCHCPITAAMLARVLRDRIHVPLVFTYHTRFDVDIEKSVHGRLLQEESKRLLVENISACDEVWTVSEGAGENLRSLGYEGDYHVMQNGVDFPVGRVGEEEIHRAAENYDLPGNVPVFLYVGRMMWYKGVRVTLDALQRLQSRGKDFRMVFVGGGTDKEEIMKYTRALGLETRVFFADPIHDREVLRAWYCRADLFLFPSEFDTNGLVVREAAACGLASVLVSGSCASEGITDGRNGFLTGNTPEDMAGKLEAILTHPECMKTVGETAQREIYLSWDDAVHTACERYNVILENYRRGLYAGHQKIGDEAFHAMASAMNGIQQAENWFFGRYAQLRSRMEEDRQTAQELWSDFTDLFM